MKTNQVFILYIYIIPGLYIETQFVTIFESAFSMHTLAGFSLLFFLFLSQRPWLSWPDGVLSVHGPLEVEKAIRKPSKANPSRAQVIGSNDTLSARLKGIVGSPIEIVGTSLLKIGTK